MYKVSYNGINNMTFFKWFKTLETVNDFVSNKPVGFVHEIKFHA